MSAAKTEIPETVWQINLKLAYAVGLVSLGITITPSDPKWWAFHGLTYILYLSALMCVGDAIKGAVKLRKSERQKREIMARKAPHTAKLATNEDLKKRGML